MSAMTIASAAIVALSIVALSTAALSTAAHAQPNPYPANRAPTTPSPGGFGAPITRPVLAVLAPADDARNATPIGPGGEVYAPDGKGTWIRKQRFSTADVISAVGHAGGSLLALGEGVVYRLAANGWSAIRLHQKYGAVMSHGVRAVAAVGRQLFVLDRTAAGEPAKLASAPSNVLAIGAGSAGVVVKTDRGLFRLQGARLVAIANAPREVTKLVSDRWVLVDGGAIDLQTGRKTGWPPGTQIAATTATSDGKLVLVAKTGAGALELVTIAGGQGKTAREPVVVAAPPSSPTPASPAPASPAPASPAPPTFGQLPAPATPAPTTPAPGTPAPTTPAPGTPAPTTFGQLPPTTPLPSPTTPAPSTPAPTTPAPTTPAPTTFKQQPPTTPAPATPAPSTPAPTTPAPTTPAPTTPAPTTPAPTTPAPTTPAPTTPAPATPAPATPAPTTPAPATPAPTTPTPSITPAVVIGVVADKAGRAVIAFDDGSLLVRAETGTWTRTRVRDDLPAPKRGSGPAVSP